MRLIDADMLPVHKAYCVDEAGWGANFYVVDKEDIDNAPTIDTVPVVRCKDCKHYENHKLKVYENCVRNERYIPMLPNDFCSYGERRSE